MVTKLQLSLRLRLRLRLQLQSSKRLYMISLPIKLQVVNRTLSFLLAAESWQLEVGSWPLIKPLAAVIFCLFIRSLSSCCYVFGQHHLHAINTPKCPPFSHTPCTHNIPNRRQQNETCVITQFHVQFHAPASARNRGTCHLPHLIYMT